MKTSPLLTFNNDIGTFDVKDELWMGVKLSLEIFKIVRYLCVSKPEGS